MQQKQVQSGKDLTQKLTAKNISFGLVKNVNDEVIPGFKVLQNVNPGNVAKSLIKRAGIRQNGTIQTEHGVVESFGVPIGANYYFGTGLTQQVNYDYSTQSNIKYSMYYAFSFNAPTDNYMTSLEIVCTRINVNTAVPAGCKLNCKIYNGQTDYNNNQVYILGSLVAISSSILDLADLNNDPNYKLGLKFEFNNVKLTAGQGYIFVLELLKNDPINDPIYNNIMFNVSETQVNNINSVGLCYSTTTSGASIYDGGGNFLGYAGGFNLTTPIVFTNVLVNYPPSFNVNTVSAITTIGYDITNIECSNIDIDNTYYVSGMEEDVLDYKGQTKNRLGNLKVNNVKMLDPAQGNPLSTSGLLNLYTGVGIINPLDFNQNEIGAEYGFKSVGSYHNYFIPYGNQLKNKVPIKEIVVPGIFNKSFVIDNANGMMFKRYSVNNVETMIPVTAEVIADPVKVEYQLNTTFNNGFSYIVDNTIALYTGQYEYAIEWIDNQGFII